MLDRLRKEVFRQIKKADTKEHLLTYLFWECTQRCNLSCLHCGSDCLSSSRYVDMPKEDFLNVLDQIGHEKHPEAIVVITGGEPLLRKDLEECGMEIRKRGFRWGIVSNGYHYDQERHISLLNAGMGSITISLDGTKENHNWLRNNKKSYERAIEALCLIARSERLTSDVVTCVNKKNLHELEDIYQTIRKTGMQNWRLFTITPIGRAKENDDMLLDSDAFTYLMDFIENKRKQGEIDVTFSCEGYIGKYETKARDDYFFCRAGINIGSVLINGDIGACPNINRSFVQGNIYSDNFMDVWNNRFQSYRNRDWTKTGQCATCKEYKYCLGNGLHYWTEQKDKPLYCHFQHLK